MSLGALIVITLRLLVPFTIFKKNLTGGILCMIVDGIDVILIDLMHLGGFGGHYHQIDKVLDTYYLSFEFFIATRWANSF